MKEFYNHETEVNEAICCNCKEIHYWNEEDCEIYRGRFLCKKCFENKFGYCNECGELNKYTDMNENIICKRCVKNV